MTKYRIILHDYTFSGYKQEHKKSGMCYWSFSQILWNDSNGPMTMEFQSSQEAKCFLLTHSTCQKAIRYAASIPNEETLDKLILKGSYKLSRCKWDYLPSHLEGILLCECAVVEIN